MRTKKPLIETATWARAKKPALINAAQIAIEHPDTFQRLPEAEFKGLRPGDLVKISNGGERFWLIVCATEYPFFIGAVNNQLIFPNGLRLGTKVAFHADNIHDVETREEIEARLKK